MTEPSEMLERIAKQEIRTEALLREVELRSKAHANEHTASNLALELARETVDKRLEGMNEFREQLREQSGTFVTNDKMDIRIDALIHRLSALEKTSAMGEGRTAVVAVIVSAAIALAVAWVARML